MSRPLQVLAVSSAALVVSVGLLIQSGCSIPEESPASKSTTSTVSSPFPDIETVDGLALEARIPEALSSAAGRGADVRFALLDRRTGAYFASGDTDQLETASVSKLFIVDDVLRGAELTQTSVAADDLASITTMLTSSDDSAATYLWSKYGGSDIVERVAQRYGLAFTTAPWDGQWWNTTTSAGDIVAYYNRLLDGRGGLSPASTAVMLGLLRESAPVATDGYLQHFGIVDGLPSEAIHAVKQGWMCCIVGRWLHLSTGTVGVDNRYVIAILSREEIQYDDGVERYPDTSVFDVSDDSSARHARDTVTGFVNMLFPDGRID